MKNDFETMLDLHRGSAMEAKLVCEFMIRRLIFGSAVFLVGIVFAIASIISSNGWLVMPVVISFIVGLWLTADDKMKRMYRRYEANPHIQSALRNR